MLLIERGFLVRSGKKVSFLRTEDKINVIVPPGFSLHHRKPRRCGGETSKRNISVVLRIEHDAWNVLFDNHPTLKVAELLEGYWEIFGNNKSLSKSKNLIWYLLESRKKTKKKKNIFNASWLHRIEALGVSRSFSKKLFSWVLLFNELSLDEIITKINKVWIDPDCQLAIKTIQVKKIVMVPRAGFLFVLT